MCRLPDATVEIQIKASKGKNSSESVEAVVTSGPNAGIIQKATEANMSGMRSYKAAPATSAAYILPSSPQ